LCCAWTALFFFLCTLLTPHDALSFDSDTLVTAAIVSGITIGVALIVVLVAGTFRDVKRGRDKDDEDDDVWTRSPVLRTLGYRYADNPLFSGSSPRLEGLEGRQEIEAFLAGRIDRIPSDGRQDPSSADPGCFRLGGESAAFSLSYPGEGGNEHPPPFSLWLTGSRSCRILDETGGKPETT
jgi:hypothetical protein